MPVKREAREGQHRAQLYICVKRRPEEAKESMCGVEISEPKHPTSLKPRSSARIRIMFGWVFDFFTSMIIANRIVPKYKESNVRIKLGPYKHQIESKVRHGRLRQDKINSFQQRNVVLQTLNTLCTFVII